MRRSSANEGFIGGFVVVVVLGCAWLQVGCGGGTLSGGAAGGPGGRGGTGGSVILTGAGGTAGSPAGSGGDPYVECYQPLTTSRVPSSHLLVLDTSLAMNAVACASGCGTTSKWGAAVDAINATVGVTQADVDWGLKLFGDATLACASNEGAEVTVGPNTAPAIAAALAARTSTASGDLTDPGNRPTRAAVIAATQHLNAQPIIGPSYLVLVTAGVPSCLAGSTDTVSDDTTATVDAIAATRTMGVPTFVVALGTQDAPAMASLLQMAAAGDPGLPGGHVGYYAASTSAELQTVLRGLVVATPSCRFTIPPPPNNLADPDHLQVFFGDSQLPRDANHAEGWDYTDPDRTIQLYGKACDNTQADRAQLPIVRYGCPAV